MPRTGTKYVQALHLTTPMHTKLPSLPPTTFSPQKLLEDCSVSCHAGQTGNKSSRALVRFLFPPVTGTFLLRASIGCSSSTAGGEEDDEPSSGQKGISRERTFRSGRSDVSWQNSKLEDIVHLLASDMAKKNLQAHTLTVKVKLSSFDVLSKSKTMPKACICAKAKK